MALTVTMDLRNIGEPNLPPPECNPPTGKLQGRSRPAGALERQRDEEKIRHADRSRDIECRGGLEGLAKANKIEGDTSAKKRKNLNMKQRREDATQQQRQKINSTQLKAKGKTVESDR
eukprot:GHVT01080246.1.p4 GENE.GHVT01080246.1~~GHVT01080246.1.p4  ORF type:complete len:118 (-),score=23.39 GHVT01080246.1:152-505(-)